MSIEIRHLRQFIVVADELHFTRAAARLHLAQPALSAQIKKLETELRMRLFARNTRTVELTSEGADFLVLARAAVAAYDEAISSARTLSETGAGTVSLGVNPRMRPAIRMGLIKQLVPSNISIDFVAESSVRLVAAVAAGQIDAALSVAPSSIGDLRAVLVKEDPLVVALPEGHPLSGRSELRLTDLRDETWILPSKRVYESNSILRSACEDAGFTMRVSNMPSDYDDDFTNVALGNGIEVVPSVFIQTRSVRGVAFVDLDGPTIPIHVMHRPDRASPALRTVIEAIREYQRTSDPVP